jgi:ABC-type lipoprotein export system ATPase subunit
LFQDLRLFPELTAYENVQLKNSLTNYKTEEEIVEWFVRLGIKDKLNQYVSRMSFGQQQRVALIRALCQPMDFLFLDEPVSHLDDDNGHVMAELITEEAQRQEAGIIVTSIGKRLDLNYDYVLKL